MSKCLGGYQIIDLKGAVPNDDITDPEIIAKVKYALELKKPVYISNYYDDNLEVMDGPILMVYNKDVQKLIGLVPSDTATDMVKPVLAYDEVENVVSFEQTEG